MADPRTFWLTVTNIVLGVCSIVLVGAIVARAVCEVVTRLRKRHALDSELNGDMRKLFGTNRPKK